MTAEAPQQSSQTIPRGGEGAARLLHREVERLLHRAVEQQPLHRAEEGALDEPALRALEQPLLVQAGARLEPAHELGARVPVVAVEEARAEHALVLEREGVRQAGVGAHDAQGAGDDPEASSRESRFDRCGHSGRGDGGVDAGRSPMVFDVGNRLASIRGIFGCADQERVSIASAV